MLLTILGIGNIIMALVSVVLIWHTWRRHKRHKIHMMMIRMSRMNPVSCIKANRKSNWIAIGVYLLGYEIGSNMPWEEETILLDKYYDSEIRAIQNQTNALVKAMKTRSP